jgi:hypothetical protein
MNCFDCYKCQIPKIKEVPLLKCGHYICTDCYIRLKNTRIVNCLICNEKLKRSAKREKLIKDIHELNLSFS